ncbi:hypothetical protein [Kitasatospora sp. NPDC088548]|uniref:hypothetical protein n=1 Tax=Kitasatospora sp. NPDC088548 TaxID=3364075 RepID=UPI003824B39E
MAVILANRQFTAHVSPHPWPRDAHGTPIAPAPGSVPAGNSRPLPGSAIKQQDGTWSLRVDPTLWPLRVGDRIVATTNESWTVDTARLCAVAGHTAADYIAVTATLDPPEVP